MYFGENHKNAFIPSVGNDNSCYTFSYQNFRKKTVSREIKKADKRSILIFIPNWTQPENIKVFNCQLKIFSVI